MTVLRNASDNPVYFTLVVSVLTGLHVFLFSERGALGKTNAAPPAVRLLVSMAFVVGVGSGFAGLLLPRPSLACAVVSLGMLGIYILVATIAPLGIDEAGLFWNVEQSRFTPIGMVLALAVGGAVLTGLHELETRKREERARQNPINAGLPEEPRLRLGGRQIESTSDARSLFAMDGDELDRLITIPRRLSPRTPAAGISVVACDKGAGPCAPTSPNATVFRMCALHLERWSHGASDRWVYVFSPPPCGRPLGRSPLKLFFVDSPEGEWATSYITFGLAETYSSPKFNLVGYVDFEPDFYEPLMDHSSSAGLAWARRSGLVARVVEVDPLD
jgi:hypothetical protein